MNISDQSFELINSIYDNQDNENSTFVVIPETFNCKINSIQNNNIRNKRNRFFSQKVLNINPIKFEGIVIKLGYIKKEIIIKVIYNQKIIKIKNCDFINTHFNLWSEFEDNILPYLDINLFKKSKKKIKKKIKKYIEELNNKVLGAEFISSLNNKNYSMSDISKIDFYEFLKNENNDKKFAIFNYFECSIKKLIRDWKGYKIINNNIKKYTQNINLEIIKINNDKSKKIIPKIINDFKKKNDNKNDNNNLTINNEKNIKNNFIKICETNDNKNNNFWEVYKLYINRLKYNWNEILKYKVYCYFHKQNNEKIQNFFIKLFSRKNNK